MVELAFVSDTLVLVKDPTLNFKFKLDKKRLFAHKKDNKEPLMDIMEELTALTHKNFVKVLVEDIAPETV